MDVHASAEHLAAADTLWGPRLRDAETGWGTVRGPEGRFTLPVHPTAAAGLLAVVLILGTLGVLLLRSSASDTAPTPVSPASSSAPSGVEGFAELFVATFLGSAGEGTEASLQPFLATPVSLSGVQPGSLYVARTASLGATALDDRYWSVLVAADVMTPVEGGYAPAGLRYYQVGVLEDDGRYVATALPGQVPAPPVADAPDLTLRYLGMPTDDPVTDLARRFVAAFLAGQGELEDVVAPGTGLRPVQPAPFAGTELRRVGILSPTDGSGVHLASIEVEGTASSGAVSVVDYVLEVTERGGTWEVTDLLPGAPLQGSRDGR